MALTACANCATVTSRRAASCRMRGVQAMLSSAALSSISRITPPKPSCISSKQRLHLTKRPKTLRLRAPETIRMELSRVVGIAVETGGFYSHVGILTRNLGIPTVCGVQDIFRQLPEGETVVVDGDGASVAAGLSDGELLEYRAVIEEKKRRAKRLESYRSRPSVSASGTRGLICANIGSAAEAEAAAAEGAEGVGLFRSEFLYMDQTSLPDEETQFQAYVKALKAMDGKPVIIRTLDAGGDKQIPGLKMPAEDNPFLGCRALRLCLKNEELFLTQLRALLRAGREGTLEIMFPMVSGLEELRRAKAMLKKAAGQLRERGIEPSEPKVGIMIEIPSAALMAEALAGEADFFSIGTNDLIQYTLAAERGNPGVEDIYSPYHPAVLRLIAMTAKAAAKAGIVCGMCGEMAADLKLLPALWGMGVRELSMSAKAMTAARETLSQWSDGDCEELAKAVLSCGSEEELRKVCGAAAVLSS